jgi:hypothetical protein
LFFATRGSSGKLYKKERSLAGKDKLKKGWKEPGHLQVFEENANTERLEVYGHIVSLDKSSCLATSFSLISSPNPQFQSQRHRAPEFKKTLKTGIVPLQFPQL